jgi:Replication-relaxation
MPDKTLKKSLTSHRLGILKQLAEYRFLTTNQIHRLSPRKWLQQTQEDLIKLREFKLILGSPTEREKGKASEFVWVLLKKGADVLVANGTEIKYSSHFRFIPERERIAFRDTELEFEFQVKSAGWKLIKPITYNQHKPLPDRTEQYLKLTQAVTFLHQARVLPGISLDSEGVHTIGVPLKTNDYVAYTFENKAVVFVLHPPGATEKFWEIRLKKYRVLIKDLKVVGVFETEPTALAHKALLEEGKFMVTTVERVGKGLVSLAR